MFESNPLKTRILVRRVAVGCFRKDVRNTPSVKPPPHPPPSQRMRYGKGEHIVYIIRYNMHITAKYTFTWLNYKTCKTYKIVLYSRYCMIIACNCAYCFGTPHAFLIRQPLRDRGTERPKLFGTPHVLNPLHPPPKDKRACKINCLISTLKQTSTISCNLSEMGNRRGHGAWRTRSRATAAMRRGAVRPPPPVRVAREGRHTGDPQTENPQCKNL